MSDTEELIRAVNANIAKGYDALAYEAQPNPTVSAERVLGVAALYGATPPFGDVLDIACGRGARLDALGDEMTGQLVGVDIAETGLEEARVRLGRFRDRVKLVHGDLMDVMPGDLGQFDLIYATGLVFVVPHEVRRRTLKLIAACLKPGGVAVISYYAGANAAVRSILYRLLRNGIDPNAPPEAKVAVARKRLAQIAEFASDNPAEAAVREAVEFAGRLPDVSLFHEALNEAAVPINTGDLEAELAPQGVQFLGYSEHGLVAPTSRERAWAADFLDLVQSPYRYGVFAKVADGAPNMKSDKVRWSSILQRKGEAGYGGPATFAAEDGRTVDIPAAFTQAALDELASAGALAWGEMAALAKARLKAAGLEADADAEDKLQAHFQGLWRVGFVSPLRMKDQ